MKIALSAETYREPDAYKAERLAIWASEWIMFCTAAELTQPGNYFADELAGFNLLLVVNPEGTIVGFHNVCPHRAGVLAWPGQGTLGNLVCKYHGWAFGWDGQLKSARDFGNDEPLCAEHSELKKIRVETWGPLVFVCLSEETPPLIESLGSFVGRATSFPIETFSYARRLTRELNCNWKTYIDNYLEGYHVQLIHPSLNRALKMSTYTVSVHDDSYCVHECEPSDGSPVAGVWLFRYPNLAVNIYPDGMNVERIMPIGHNKTHIVYDYFSVDTSDENIARMVAMSNEILDEDQDMCEVVQKNLNSGIYEAGPLSPRHEICLEWFQSKVKKATL